MQIISAKRILSTTAIPTTTKSKRQLFLPYGSNDVPFPNQFYTNQVFDTTMNVEMNYQGDFDSLKPYCRQQREINMDSFSVILTVALFLGYMTIDFGLNDGLPLRVSRDLFVMIVAVFILIIALNKNDLT